MALEPSYKVTSDAAIRDLLLEFECQPILFIGSGISKRYFNAPNWIDLLKEVYSMVPNGDYTFDYLRQKFNDDAIEIGTAISNEIFEWAWKDGKNHFPSEMFSNKSNRDDFLKYLIAEYFRESTPEISEIDNKSLSDELTSFEEIRPHAIITTNYDLFLESVFSGYETITGQTILRYNTNSFGEIFHIHGDISDSRSIVVTGKDYDEWIDKKKYVSAKLLTYFAEHPVFIMGYGLGDPNVKAILRDIGELVADESGLIPNVYQIIWHSGELDKHPSDQAVFEVDGKEFRTKAIHTNDLAWIFQALKSRSAISSINPKLVRALAARTMKLIRQDIPSGNVKVDYDVLERVANNTDELPSLLGITLTDNPNQSHPYTLTQVAGRLGLPGWHAAGKIINKIKDETGKDIRSTDNCYHCKIKTGNKASSITRKWSNQAVDLLKKANSGEEYALNLPD